MKHTVIMIPSVRGGLIRYLQQIIGLQNSGCRCHTWRKLIWAAVCCSSAGARDNRKLTPVHTGLL